MAEWQDEANWPEAWSEIHFSPIVVSGGHFIVYVGGTGVVKFYKYDIDTDEWTELAAPPGSIYGAISMSPDGTKLAAHTNGGNVLFIYDIAGNSWSSSSAAPNLATDGGIAAEIRSSIWADDDTIWCQVRAYNPGWPRWEVKCYRYVVSTDTWTQFTNYITPAQHAGQCMSVNSAGTALFVGGIGASKYYALKYIIATDTYSTFSIGSGWRFYFTRDRAAKLWHWDILDSYLGVKYYDCDTETASAIIFPHDSEKTKPTNLTCGIYGVTGIIAWHMTVEPKNRSYRVITVPAASTDPVTPVEAETAEGNGDITDNGGEDCDKRGFVYNTSSHGDPGDTAPADSEYAHYVEETDSFGTGAFSLSLTSLEPETTYFVRAYAHNSVGYSYGDEVEFTTLALAEEAMGKVRGFDFRGGGLRP